MNLDELRRAPRVRVCCRVDVRQRFAAWSAVTEEVSARGCRIVTNQLPRLGAVLDLTLSSDIFPEALEVLGEVVWITAGRLGVLFVEPKKSRREGSLSAASWVDRVLEQGRPPGSPSERVVPVVSSAGPASQDRQGAVVPIGLADRRRSV